MRVTEIAGGLLNYNPIVLMYTWIGLVTQSWRRNNES